MHICKAFGYLCDIHMYMVNEIFTSSRYKEIIMVQPKPSAGLKGKPHQHALTFMPPCSGLGKILTRYAQQLGDAFLIEIVYLAPPLAELTLLAFLQN